MPLHLLIPHQHRRLKSPRRHIAFLRTPTLLRLLLQLLNLGVAFLQLAFDLALTPRALVLQLCNPTAQFLHTLHPRRFRLPHRLCACFEGDRVQTELVRKVFKLGVGDLAWWQNRTARSGARS